MTRSIVTILALAGAALIAQNAGVVLDIGSNLEPFFDATLIDSMKGVTLKLHEPQSAGTVFTFDRPWEGNVSTYAVIIKDGDRFRMWYRGSVADDYTRTSVLKPGEKNVPKHGPVVCYAESRDGDTWTRPNLGIVEFNGSRENNIVLDSQVAESLYVFKDRNPAAPESERYKGWIVNRGLVGMKSADGIHWSKISERKLITDGNFDSLNSAIWDSVHNRYIAVYRINVHGVRGLKIAFSKDFQEWTPGVLAEYGDAPTEHIYTNAAQTYFRAPQVLLAFPKRFVFNRKPWPDSAALGISESVFMTSRDAIHWNRTFLEAFVRPGREERNWVHRSNMIAPNLVQTGPDEMSFYIDRHYTFPSNHLERMKMRLDGIASVHADYKGGEFVTKPFTFEGTKLILNFATSAVGSIQVEIQDDRGKPLPGFALTETPVLFGDKIEHVFEPAAETLSGYNPFRSLAGKAIRLRFVMKDADLYSIQFR